MNAREAKFLALLVHKGFLDEDRARVALAMRDDGEPLGGLLERLGHLPAGEGTRLWDNLVGEEPAFTRYEVLGRLGDGATARVLEVRDRQDGGRYALKLLKEEVARRKDKLARFVEEAQLLCDLDDPGIVKGHRVAKDRGQVFVVMDLVEGRTIEEDLNDDVVLGEDEALDVVHQVAGILVHLREQGIVHRDLKPGNLMRGPDGRVVLIDLGFAARLGETEDSATTLGTVQYIAPEQARGEGGLDARADIYALGASLYHMATGHLPFPGESTEEILAKQVALELSSERIRELGLTPVLHYFIEKMMAKDREIRYSDPAELLADIEEKCADRPFLGGGAEPAEEPKARKVPLSRRHAKTRRQGGRAGGRRRRR
ncbi:MAG: serine/threonine-protein kinase [Planctomycetota bacterium]